MGVSVGVWRVSVGVCRVSGGVIGGYKTHMNSQNPRYNQYNHTSGFLPVPPNHSNYLKWSKFSDPMYGGSNELFDKNQNFPLVLNIKLHLKLPVIQQLQISHPTINAPYLVFSSARVDSEE